jgi:hypothetical protein
VDLYYRAHLFWRGEDADGTVQGFRWAIDDTSTAASWNWTTRTDSIFRFEVAEIGAQEHLFLIRAIDNLGKQDPSPDTLRFESFTTANPTIDTVFASAQSPQLGRIDGLRSGDTVEVFSDITVCWDGSDLDGEVVGWESKFDAEGQWRFHELDDRCRTETRLDPGSHIMSLRAIDDAGAKSSVVRRFRIQSNFDPVTDILEGTLFARLPRPWMGDTLEVGPGVTSSDTLPLGATLDLCWQSSDIDGPVVRYSYSLGGVIGQTEATCISTDTTGTDPSTGAPIPEPLPRSDGGAGLPFLIKAIDIYENVEQRPDTLALSVNHRPFVEFTGPDLQVVPAGPPIQFEFTGRDADSDPATLAYRWRFSFEASSTQPALVYPDTFVTRAFTPSQVGDHTLTIWAQDASGNLRESLPDMITIRVTTTSADADRRRSAEGVAR